MIASMAITPARLEKVNFVHYYTSGASIVVPNASKVTSSADLKGVTVGVGLGTTYEKKAIELGAKVKPTSSTCYMAYEWSLTEPYR
jgi:polar amino acid transport system substrate-binding protein